MVLSKHKYLLYHSTQNISIAEKADYLKWISTPTSSEE